MKIAIISDTHGKCDAVERAVTLIGERKVDFIVHCGDIDDVDTVGLFPPNTHFVFGNCDYDRAGLRQAVRGIGATLHEPYGELEAGEVRLAFLHGDDKDKLEELEALDYYDYVFHGHTHVADEHTCGKTRVINPGALYRVRTRTFAVLDLASGELERVVVA